MMSLQDLGTGDSTGTREVSKNGWLKKIPNPERRLSAVMGQFLKPPKAEKLWVSFCVHDDTEGWLEFYENRRSAFSHNPIGRTSLNRCLHVSPSIRVHEDEHVFNITLEGEVIKLCAQNREQMMEWIDALRLKLRELGVLTPKDNLYTREPEGLRSPSLRNPNSPLPPTPTFQFPPNSSEFREEISSIPSLRSGISPAQSMTLSSVSGLSSIQSLNSISSSVSDPNTSPSSVISYVRNPHDTSINRLSISRRSSLRHSLPNSPTTPVSGPGSVSFVRSPPGPTGPPREHITIINVPSTSGTIFNFDTVSAALESSGTMANSQLYGTVYPSQEDRLHDPDQDLYVNTPDSNAIHLKVGNWHSNRPPLPPHQRSLSHTLSGPVGMSAAGFSMGASGTNGSHNNIGNDWMNSNEGTYEPLFLASEQTSSNSQNSVPQAPNTGLLRRRSEHRRSGRREHGRRAASVGPSIAPRQQQYQVGSDGRLISLREQQVIRLQREIAHQAGVRLTLRKKDCLNSIAFVNCFNQVFVAGWKQREHPYLHNTFHIGDKVMTVCGIKITSAAEVQSIIRSDPTNMIEFIIKRVPYGKVFNLKKESEGQALGIIREGNTAEIREVIHGGLASLHGVPTQSPTVDGLSLVPWVLTEINHRPLNLFFKHSEIADRLNAVGRDISILIQPMDLVKQMKKQLKLIKGYKDYIVM